MREAAISQVLDVFNVISQKCNESLIGLIVVSKTKFRS